MSILWTGVPHMKEGEKEGGSFSAEKGDIRVLPLENA